MLELFQLLKQRIMNNPLKNLIEIIKIGRPIEVKSAQKEVEKFWHNVYIPQREKGRQCFRVFLDELKNFEQIKDIDHQVYFINTLKWPLWVIGEEYFEDWAEFILRYIQHPSGKIRQAVLRVSDYLIMDILDGLRFDSNKEISQAEKERVEENKNRFCQFVFSIETLFEKYYESKFNRYKYISSLPPSIYKSLEIFFSDLLRNETLENMYLEYKYEKQKQNPEEFNISGLKLAQKEKEWDYYYDAMEYLNLGDTKMAKMLLGKAIEINEDFVAGYVGMTAVAKEEKNRKKEKEYSGLAFKKTSQVFPK